MNKIKIQILTAAYLICFSASAFGQKSDNQASNPKAFKQKADSISCVVNGTVIDRPESTYAFIIEADKDFRVHPGAHVPIKDGKFTIGIKDSVPMAYQVVFEDELKRGSWHNRYFFSGNGDIELIYNSNGKENEDRVVSDIYDNVLAMNFAEQEERIFMPKVYKIYALCDSLDEHKATYTKEYQDLLDKMDRLPNGIEKDSIKDIIIRMHKGPKEKKYSKEYLKYQDQAFAVYAQIDSLKRSMISQNPSVFGLHSVRNAFMMAKDYNTWIDIPAYIEIFENLYRSQMADHPYTSEIQGLIDALQVVAGNKYPDYTVRREDGSTEQISALIKGNVAVIDLWASWCGPCRKHSKELIPLYEKYKDRGFKVIAVARESENCYAMNHAMKQDGYPWESFVDLNDRDKVWQKNQAGNGGGKIILVNSDGIIVGTDIPTEDIKAFLVKIYGD